jgi:NADPH-dependent 2,4-dienoyl-CoA reductase/sulfur reductase-like enzyme
LSIYFILDHHYPLCYFTMSTDIPTHKPLGGDVPGMILIIGSGVFGLSTAYALCQREEFNDSKIVVIDRWPFPAPDGASV